MTYYDVEPTGTIEGDKAAVITAALAARDAGELTVRLADGDWKLDGLTVSDIYDRYLLLERGTVTPGSYVYPWRPHEWAQRSGFTRGRSGNGRIAIEVDDAIPTQWTSLFPLTKKLGIPLSVAWHTGSTHTQWIPEAHRHGWEIMSHLPYDIRATDALADGTLEQLAQDSHDAIAAIVGADVPIGFVYPQHYRSAETDAIMRKYFDRGRGIAVTKIYSRHVPHSWLTAAKFLDTSFAGGVVAEDVRRALRKIAATDSQMVFYMHWGQNNIDAGHPAALESMVKYARELGIEITTSGQIWGDANLVDDPYFTRSADWLSTQANNFLTAGDTWHGDQALRISTSGTFFSPNRSIVKSQPGMMTKIRCSFRRKNAANVVYSAGKNGVRAGGTLAYRKKGADQRATSAMAFGGDFALTGTVTPGEWVEEDCIFYVHPAVEEIGTGLGIQNQVSGELLVDELRYVVEGYQQSWVGTATLAGTSNVFVYHPIVDLSTKFRVKIEPEAPLRGALNVSISGSQILLSSTVAADRQKVLITITPRGAWFDEDD